MRSSLSVTMATTTRACFLLRSSYRMDWGGQRAQRGCKVICLAGSNGFGCGSLSGSWDAWVGGALCSVVPGKMGITCANSSEDVRAEQRVCAGNGSIVVFDTLRA